MYWKKNLNVWNQFLNALNWADLIKINCTLFIENDKKELAIMSKMGSGG